MYSQSSSGFPFDPILQFRPSFARSLPIQILVTGIVLTLTSVLLIHLVFTAQYHWKLARANFILQAAAIVVLLSASIANLMVVVDSCIEQSKTWPYMLNYIAVDLPPLTQQTIERGTWSTSRLTGWQLVTALWGALIQASPFSQTQ